jgi:hypothetical protein
LLSLPLAGCSDRSQPQVIQGTGDEVSAEQIAIEEEELETGESP